MTGHTMETVTFKLVDGASPEAFVAAAAAVTEYVRERDGFVSRRLSVDDDGLWIEHIEWRTLAAAKAAAAGLGSVPSIAPFLNAIDGDTVTMHHTTLEVSADR